MPFCVLAGKKYMPVTSSQRCQQTAAAMRTERVIETRYALAMVEGL
jgi:hypothetical protein